MPWCEECAKYRTPNSVNDDGTCPTCGASLQLPDGVDSVDDAAARAADEKSPWHFKLLVVMVVGYLGWRLVQLFV
jgi:PHP family Zn ribbon phosphoesterase